jgi:hypothetical protein
VPFSFLIVPLVVQFYYGTALGRQLSDKFLNLKKILLPLSTVIIIDLYGLGGSGDVQSILQTYLVVRMVISKYIN